MGMDYWEISDDDIAWAQGKAHIFNKPDEHKDDLQTNNSILIGYLGERIFWNRFPEARYLDQTHSDFLYGSWTIDVKSALVNGDFRKRPSVHINDFSKHRVPQAYVFVFLNLMTRTAFFPGYITRNDWIKESELVQAGGVNPYYKKLIYKHNVRVLPVWKLRQFKNDEPS